MKTIAIPITVCGKTKIDVSKSYDNVLVVLPKQLKQFLITFLETIRSSSSNSSSPNSHNMLIDKFENLIFVMCFATFQ